MIKRLLNSKFIMNTGWLVFAQIYQMVVSLIIGVISARYLGPANYGTINYAASYISFFSIASALGLEGIVVKEMVSDRDKEGVILGSGIWMRFWAGILSMFAVTIIVFVTNANDPVLLVVTVLQALILPFNAFHLIDTWYQSMLRSKVSTLVKCAAYTIMSVYKIVLLILGKSVEWFAFSTSLDSLLIAIFFVLLYRKHGTHKLQVNFAVSKQLFSQSYHLVIAHLMSVIYTQMDRIMIGQMLGSAEVGYYAAATTICSMWVFIPQAFANSARPLIVQQKGVNEELYIKRLKQLSCFIFWLGIGFAVFITLLSKLIVYILYGVNYMDARHPMKLIIWSTVFSALSQPRATWMICEKRQNCTKYIVVWGCVVNLVLNFFWIPQYGIMGAATATLITEIVCCLVAPLFYKDTRIFIKYLLEAICFKGVFR